ncbi:MAG: hypothetical protein ACLTDM_07210 [Clostridium butyricum]
MKSIFIWDEYEKEYIVDYFVYSYGYYINTRKGKLIKSDKLELDLNEPELNVDESIYLEDRGMYLNIENKFRTDKDNILYKCKDILIPSENDKELRELAEKQLKDKEMEKQNQSSDIEEESKSFWDKLKLWRY